MIITTLPHEPFKLSRRHDNSFQFDTDDAGSNGLFVLSRDLPEDRELNVHIYLRHTRKATEPDFVLYMSDKFSDKEIVYQLFIEPKGDHLLMQDEWKEQFLMEIETENIIELYQNQEYRLIGMPFYNKVNREEIFETKLNEIAE